MLWRYLQPELTSQEQESLLWLARDAIAGELSAKPSSPAHSADPALERKAGAFVTLNLNGELRGCIGHMSADQPLRTIIPEMARAAAFSDPRFPSLSSDELDRVRIEISVLSPIHRITDTQRIRLGTDGLMLDSGGAQGVFLPQVPVQEGWDLGAYLQNLCSKAGLLRGCWSDAALYTFTAEVFGEDER
jgi:hypothetical protein